MLTPRLSLFSDRWSIVLAGGEGVRLRPYVQARFGDDRPKQYCAFVGSRSMVEHTLDRAHRLSEDRIVTIVSASHRRWASQQVHTGSLVHQPRNRDTGPGLFLPLALVKARDPDAVVYILPSDHYVRPVDRFVAAVRRAGDIAERNRRSIVLAGVPPTCPDVEYGYIEPGAQVDVRGQVAKVARFVEKPDAATARAAIARGAVWNTFVMAASVRAFWEAGREVIPDVVARFDALIPHLGKPTEEAAIAATYDDMPHANFSRDVLEHVTDRCILSRLDGVEWSDWGAADRIEETLARRGAQLGAAQLAVG